MCFSESSVLALFSGKMPTFRLQSDFPAKGATDFSVNYRKFGFWCRQCSLPENRKYNRKIGLDPRTRQFTGKSDCNRTVGILPEKQMNSPIIEHLVIRLSQRKKSKNILNPFANGTFDHGWKWSEIVKSGWKWSKVTRGSWE